MPVTVWNEAGDHAASAILIHGTMAWGTACFERQRSLADRYRLLVVDRRGFGASPDIDRSDHDVDALDVVDLLDAGRAHVVGHSVWWRGGFAGRGPSSRRGALADFDRTGGSAQC